MKNKFLISLTIVLTFKPRFISNSLLKLFGLYESKIHMDEQFFTKYYKKVGRLSLFYVLMGVFLGTSYGVQNQLNVKHIVIATISLFIVFIGCSILYLMISLPDDSKTN